MKYPHMISFETQSTAAIAFRSCSIPKRTMSKLRALQTGLWLALLLGLHAQTPDTATIHAKLSIKAVQV